MAPSNVPTDVREFLHDGIESYEQLEILLLLRTRLTQSWESSSVAAELHIPEPVAEQELRALCRQRLLNVAVSPRTLLFRYRPEDPELAALVEKLAEVYAEHRIEIMRLMTRNAIERLRSGALRTFANAFLVRKNGDKDG